MNKFQKAFVKEHNIHFQKNRKLDFASINYQKEYKVFSAFKKYFLSMEEVKEILKHHSTNSNDFNKISKQIEYKTKLPSDVSSFISAIGLDIKDTLYLIKIKKSDYLLNNLIWRLFYYQTNIKDLYVEKGPWIYSEKLQKVFYEGRTGYEVIDAAILCLKKTGKMTNRHRMTCAIFFCKNLYQPWFDGAKFFSKYLEDYDEVLNNGNWVWCSQIRFDNQPFIRFINPVKELKRTDKEWFEKWKPVNKEKPIVDWKESCLKYRMLLKEFRDKQKK